MTDKFVNGFCSFSAYITAKILYFASVIAEYGRHKGWWVIDRKDVGVQCYFDLFIP